ncbi:MAG: hypothetical protein JO061_05335 [Acidobacteriaceae bacterium]|nr:hypothetical protein [Acidobacteriaceae bacterium]
MARLPLFEIHDCSWCPSVVRNALTDFLQIAIEFQDTYRPIKQLLLEAISSSGARRVVDLCSGAGGPWISWLRKQPSEVLELPVLLTDKYPNAAAAQRFKCEFGERLQYSTEPVDATEVPSYARGFRTMFTAFHHFPPAVAKAVIEDAVRCGEGIGIFEFTSCSVWALLRIALTSPVGVLWLTLRSKNASWKTLLLTYVLPVIPAVVTIDGILSCLRSYSVGDLRALATGRGYTWKAGKVKGITFLLGCPLSQPAAPSLTPPVADAVPA